MIPQLTLKRILTDEQGEALKGKFLDESYIHHPIISTDTDAYDNAGNMLFRFRKAVLPLHVLKAGVENFEPSITLTEGRGVTSGSSHKRVLKNGTVSKITVGNKVLSGNVGYLDAGGMVPYCRTTAFGRQYFDKFQAGLPFVQAIDKLYEQLAPDHYRIQKMYAEGTNASYVIDNTVFTTITVNKNFRTAAHKDSGDLEAGFGNLIVYREGTWEGGYFILPAFGVGIDLYSGDALFVNVHEFHCNTEFKNCSPDWKRISFVLYYRENMLKCDSPSKELEKIKLDKNGFFRL